MSETILELSNIKKFFTQGEQKIEVIKNGNLIIKKSELVALIGPSGSGKTTLLQISGLLDNPNSGNIKINNTKIGQDDKVRTQVRKNNIGFIYQFHHLLPEFTTLENVALPLLIQGKSREEAFKLARQTLEEVELGDRADHKPSQLSGGQQQRTAIARAIVTRPSLILADEPTGNLDFELSTKIFDLFLKLVKSHEIACLIVTHNKELSKKADRVLEIENVVNS